MQTLLTLSKVAAEFGGLALDILALIIGVRFVSDFLVILDRVLSALRFVAELTLLLLSLAISAATDAVVWLAPYAGRLAGRAYRLCSRYWPTVRRAAETARLAVARFVWAQAGYSPAPVPATALIARPVVARALPGLLPSLTRRQLLATARAVGLPRYSRLSTDRLRQALAV